VQDLSKPYLLKFFGGDPVCSDISWAFGANLSHTNITNTGTRETERIEAACTDPVNTVVFEITRETKVQNGCMGGTVNLRKTNFTSAWVSINKPSQPSPTNPFATIKVRENKAVGCVRRCLFLGTTYCPHVFKVQTFDDLVDVLCGNSYASFGSIDGQAIYHRHPLRKDRIQLILDFLN